MAYKGVLMEDISTTAGAYSKDELAIMVRHPVVSEVTRILDLQSQIEELIEDRDRSHNDIHDETRSCIDQMTQIWSLLGPACTIARRLFPEQGHLFDMLDKSKSLQDSFHDLASGRSLRIEIICDKLCCKKQLA